MMKGLFIICSVVQLCYQREDAGLKSFLLFVVVIILFYLYNEHVLNLQNFTESIWMLLLLLQVLRSDLKFWK